MLKTQEIQGILDNADFLVVEMWANTNFSFIFLVENSTYFIINNDQFS